MNEFKFILLPGQWHQYFRDKNTLKKLTRITVLQIFKEIEWTFVAPIEIKVNKNAEIVVKRVR